MWFTFGSIVLKNMVRFRKHFVFMSGFLVIGGLLYFSFYHFHLDPLRSRDTEIKRLKIELRECKNRAVEVFETQNRTVFDAYREEIKEIENEKIVADEFNSSSYDWMYK